MNAESKKIKYGILYHFSGQVDGQWGTWSTWSECSVTCDKGQRTRMRQCNAPAPMNGGKDCVGDHQQVEDCAKGRCVLGKKLSTL